LPNCADFCIETKQKINIDLVGGCQITPILVFEQKKIKNCLFFWFESANSVVRLLIVDGAN
jgi:hypothetical protein